MAAVSSSLSSLPTSNFLHFSSPQTSSQPSRWRHPIITATTSETPPITQNEKGPVLKIKPVPGDWGLPFYGAWQDRQDYLYNQGIEEFFNSRIKKYNSTVFKTNMPPGPFISSDSRVIALLDGKSFPVLFDVDKVEKKDLFTGTYMPSTELTGGYRILSYLDPSEPKHTKLKNLLFYLLKSSRDRIIPDFHNRYSELFDSIEKQIAAEGKADFGKANDQAAFDYLSKSFFDVYPKDTSLGTEGPNLILPWVLVQLVPISRVGLPPIVEDPLLHTFPLPAFLVKKQYQKLYDFFFKIATDALNEAEKQGISRDEACHNLIFATCFNSYGGLKILFPGVVKWIGQAGADLQRKLAKEIQSAIKANGGLVTMKALEEMPLMQSVVYEALRINPPVAFQYGRAKRDLVVESHDAAYQIKKGEMLFGYQPLATNDPKIFSQPKEFIPDRFLGEGEKLLKHVYWSNGPETEDPSVANKQCAGKNFVVLAARLLVVELFRRYDSFEVEIGSPAGLGSGIFITSITPATL